MQCERPCGCFRIARSSNWPMRCGGRGSATTPRSHLGRKRNSIAAGPISALEKPRPSPWPNSSATSTYSEKPAGRGSGNCRGRPPRGLSLLRFLARGRQCLLSAAIPGNRAMNRVESRAFPAETPTISPRHRSRHLLRRILHHPTVCHHHRHGVRPPAKAQAPSPILGRQEVGARLCTEGTGRSALLLADAASTGRQPLIGRTKDYAAGAVLLCARGAIVVGNLVFGPQFAALFR